LTYDNNINRIDTELLSNIPLSTILDFDLARTNTPNGYKVVFCVSITSIANIDCYEAFED
jgi:hypothetical protein